MARWIYKVDLAGALRANDEEFDLSRYEEPCPAEALERIAVECQKASPLVRFSAIIRKAKSIAEVNRILSQIYDEADRCRVWCGM